MWSNPAFGSSPACGSSLCPAGGDGAAAGTDTQRDRNHVPGASTSSTQFPGFTEGEHSQGCAATAILRVALYQCCWKPPKAFTQLCERKVLWGNSGHVSPTSLNPTYSSQLHLSRISTCLNLLENHILKTRFLNRPPAKTFPRNFCLYPSRGS